MIVRWHELVAMTPSPDEVARFAPALATAYNDPRNSQLLGHTRDIELHEVIEHYAALPYPFLLFEGDALAGDADLRSVGDGACEFAFMIASPAAQGKGLGTRFATMLHAFAFLHLGLARVYATVIPANTASRRVFEKLGYVVDETTAYGDDGDIVLRIDRATFVERHAAALADIQIT